MKESLWCCPVPQLTNGGSLSDQWLSVEGPLFLPLNASNFGYNIPHNLPVAVHDVPHVVQV
ncbi:hypothetical protein DPMN_163074 [Dreissena polymorpha]|uniref:Uncharacterized protein n=1 Tax=Dreissena polymorpha TaxID=45954 RepID=A0A9D4ESJ4_DREPO|nr:hypothetical protein DPMN_163074 [Dreissena polymorpha]